MKDNTFLLYSLTGNLTSVNDTEYDYYNYHDGEILRVENNTEGVPHPFETFETSMNHPDHGGLEVGLNLTESSPLTVEAAGQRKNETQQKAPQVFKGSVYKAKISNAETLDALINERVIEEDLANNEANTNLSLYQEKYFEETVLHETNHFRQQNITNEAEVPLLTQTSNESEFLKVKNEESPTTMLRISPDETQQIKLCLSRIHFLLLSIPY